ncbi:MFS transporter [Paeniglutamicibacter gangotriensis]|uniref:Major facilitator superfamily permease n=1 Tax=Paeniglutamicibacter gangotriensis Lz1y TaxID=1276920 RepID=M7MQJ8_9MICC|nr:MFS transporter [Paeniglutamicibacter gangotriensis]EMQ98672.1 major facilitator superfamily permease [Paeniglutamicibacter gangotriensis Lz1y]
MPSNPTDPTALAGGGESGLPEALRSPTKNVKAGWVASIVAINIGINIVFFAPINVLLGLQATEIDAGSKEAILSLVTACGASVALVANPLFGALSDRTVSKMGRRSPWILAGAILGAASLLLLSGATTVGLMLLGWCGLQAGANAAYSSVTATIPDRVPERRRGAIGGLAAMGQTVGVLLGAVVGFVISGNIAVGYFICAAALVVSVIPYVVRPNDPPLPREFRESFNLLDFFKGFWINPMVHRDFGWAWLTRFMMNTGNQMTIVYLLFFLTDVVRYPNPAGGVLILTGIYAVMVIISAVLVGPVSDRSGKRKIYVIGSSIVVACSALIIAVSQNFTGAILGAAVLGLGFGAYLAVDFALLTQVLPSATSRGKDMGVINVANALPQVIAPTLAFISVKLLGGYTALFIVAALIGICGALLVRNIRSVP